MDQTYLLIQSVCKNFGTTPVLKEINLEIMEGEFIFLLGPSGCGKTTLLRIIAGLEEATSGQIIQGGVDVTRYPPSRRNFGIVFQSYALFPNLSVYQNIAYGLENRRIPKVHIQKRVNELLDLVGLKEHQQQYPAQLSGGQQQRVALARALAISPDLLLLDEPLSALDARVRANLRIEITRLQRQLGITTIMVSHDQEEALTMADRVVVMEKGQVVQVGRPEEIYHQPATPFVADFVGLMNFIQGAVPAGKPKQVLVGDHTLHLAQDLPQQTGRPMTLAIRPETIQIVNNGQVMNVLKARVHEIEFMGPFYRLHLRLEKDGRMIAYMPPENLNNEVIRAGMDVNVFLPPNHLRIFSTNDRPPG